MKGDYTLIVPALDRTGPVSVAVDIGLAARDAGWRVRILYLSTTVPRDDLGFVSELRKFQFADLWRLSGVVHTHCLRPDILGLPLSWNRKIILVTTLHNFFLIDVGFDKPRFFVEAAWRLWKRSLRGFDVVACISEAMKRYYSRCLPDHQFQMAYNFRGRQTETQVDSATLLWIENRRASGDLVLVFVGALSERKNIRGLISALPGAASISLIVCGQGPLQQEIMAIVKNLGLQNRVRFEGQVLSPSNITRHVDALVLPSYAEGFPLAVLEAASVGVPALLSNIAVHRELAHLGFGKTFDHRRFSDFFQVAQDLRNEIPAPSVDLEALWSSKFSPRVGFAQYENLISNAIKVKK